MDFLNNQENNDFEQASPDAYLKAGRKNGTLEGTYLLCHPQRRQRFSAGFYNFVVNVLFLCFCLFRCHSKICVFSTAIVKFRVLNL